VGLGDQFGDEVATQGGEALRKVRVRGRRHLRTLVGDLDEVRQRDAAQGHNRGTRNLCGYVRHAVVECDFVDVGGIQARDGTRRLDAPAPVYGDGQRPLQLSHLSKRRSFPHASLASEL
jgi:hypothetical protein